MKMQNKVVQEFVNRPGFEALGNYPLYDTVDLAAAILPPTSTFFQHTIGANGIGVTNLLVAGQMPHPERFLITSINLMILPTVVAGVPAAITQADMEVIRTSTAIKLTVNGGNEILTAPTAVIPAGNGLVTSLAAAPSVANGWQLVKNAFPFVYPLESKVTFSATMERSGALGTLVAVASVKLILNGIRFRSSQR